jgi:NYN domain
MSIEHALQNPSRATSRDVLSTSPDAISGRVLHLTDVENLAGTASFSEPEACALHEAYERVAPGGDVNLAVIATSHHSAPAAWFGFSRTARRLVRSGTDGADMELLGVLEHEAIETRFDHVVIGSGDGIFAFEAARLQAAGVRVTVVTRRNALSSKLRLAVRDVRFIDPPAPTDTPAVTVRSIA